MRGTIKMNSSTIKSSQANLFCIRSLRRNWLTPLRFLLAAWLLLAAFETSALASPVIADNFVSQIRSDADADTILQIFDQDSNITVTPGTQDASVDMWLSGGEAKFNFGAPADENILQDPLPTNVGLFDFLADSVQSGTCLYNGRSGVEWDYTPASGNVTGIDLCAAGNTPIDLTYSTNSGTADLYFVTFTPGVPPAADFVAAPEPSPLSMLVLALACGIIAWARRAALRMTFRPA